MSSCVSVREGEGEDEEKEEEEGEEKEEKLVTFLPFSLKDIQIFLLPVTK